MGCEQCGKPFNRWQISRKVRWCRECAVNYCCRCRQPMEPRPCRRCVDCNRAERQARAANPLRGCSGCGKVMPLGITRTYCPDCDRANYRDKMRKLQAQGPRPCRECGALMPAGRRPNDCTACLYRKRKARLRKPCTQCGTRLKLPGKSYCQPCQSMYMRWWKEYQAGSYEARAMRTKKQYSRWQAKEAP